MLHSQIFSNASQVYYLIARFFIAGCLDFIGSIEIIKFLLELTSKVESLVRGIVSRQCRLFLLPKIVFSFAYAKCKFASVSSGKTG